MLCCLTFELYYLSFIFYCFRTMKTHRRRQHQAKKSQVRNTSTPVSGHRLRLSFQNLSVVLPEVSNTDKDSVYNFSNSSSRFQERYKARNRRNKILLKFPNRNVVQNKKVVDKHPDLFSSCNNISRIRKCKSKSSSCLQFSSSVSPIYQVSEHFKALPKHACRKLLDTQQSNGNNTSGSDNEPVVTSSHYAKAKCIVSQDISPHCCDNEKIVNDVENNDGTFSCSSNNVKNLEFQAETRRISHERSLNVHRKEFNTYLIKGENAFTKIVSKTTFENQFMHKAEGKNFYNTISAKSASFTSIFLKNTSKLSFVTRRFLSKSFEVRSTKKDSYVTNKPKSPNDKTRDHNKILSFIVNETANIKFMGKEKHLKYLNEDDVKEKKENINKPSACHSDMGLRDDYFFIIQKQKNVNMNSKNTKNSSKEDDARSVRSSSKMNASDQLISQKCCKLNCSLLCNVECDAINIQNGNEKKMATTGNGANLKNSKVDNSNRKPISTPTNSDEAKSASKINKEKSQVLIEDAPEIFKKPAAAVKIRLKNGRKMISRNAYVKLSKQKEQSKKSFLDKTIYYPSTSTPLDSPEIEPKNLGSLFEKVSPIIETEKCPIEVSQRFDNHALLSLRTYGKRGLVKQDKLWMKFANEKRDSKLPRSVKMLDKKDNPYIDKEVIQDDIQLFVTPKKCTCNSRHNCLNS